MNVETARDPRWIDEQHTGITLTVKFAALPMEVEFTAMPDDCEAHGRDIFARAQAGEFGPVAEYVPPVVEPA